MKQAAHLATGYRGHRVALHYATLAFAAALLSSAAPAQVLAESTSVEEPAIDPQQLCQGAESTVDQHVTGCSAVIESGKLKGRELAAAYAQRGFALTIKRNLEQAQKDLDQAVKLAPDYPVAYVNRANFWTVSNQPQRAVADAERAIKLAPNAPLAYFVRAGGEAKLEQYERAIADYNEVLRLNPNGGAFVYGPRGHAYYRKGDYDRAIADYNEQIKLNPDDVGAYLNRGDALRSKGELASAGEDYGQAIRLAPDTRRSRRTRKRSGSNPTTPWPTAIAATRSTTRRTMCMPSPISMRRSSSTRATRPRSIIAPTPSSMPATSRARSPTTARRWRFAQALRKPPICSKSLA
jgi:tetratricopeptide (TPR) repeat protein